MHQDSLANSLASHEYQNKLNWSSFSPIPVFDTNHLNYNSIYIFETPTNLQELELELEFM